MLTGRIEADSGRAVRRVIEFANHGTLEARPMLDRQAQRLRQELVRDLVLIAEGSALPESAIRALLDRARHLTITPHDFDFNTGAVVFNFNFWNWAAISSYQTLVIYAARQNGSAFPGDLRRCGLESCGKFFFMGDLRESVRGRPRSVYCCEQHMLEQHSAGSARRVARHRERRRAQRRVAATFGAPYAAGRQLEPEAVTGT